MKQDRGRQTADRPWPERSPSPTQRAFHTHTHTETHTLFGGEAETADGGLKRITENKIF